MTDLACFRCGRTLGDVRLVEHGTDDMQLCKGCFDRILGAIRDGRLTIRDPDDRYVASPADVDAAVDAVDAFADEEIDTPTFRVGLKEGARQVRDVLDPENQLSPADPPPDTVREVQIENADLTVHLPTDFGERYGDIHAAIGAELGARHIDGYDIRETYEVERY